MPTETAVEGSKMSIAIIKQFAEYGGLIGLIMGVVVVGMGVAITVLWRRGNKLQDAYNALQDKRVDEAKEVAKETRELSTELQKVIFEVTAAMNALKETIVMNARQG